MKNKKILSIIFGIIYYAVALVLFFFLFITAIFLGDIGEFSEIIFNICYIVLPAIILLIPLIFKFILKKPFYKSIIYGCISILIYIFIIITIKLSILCYFRTFSTDKWKNDGWHYFRHVMLNDLEKKYNIKGMDKNEIYKILGKGEYETTYNNGEYMISYSISYKLKVQTSYRIYFNEENKVIRTEIKEEL